MVDIEINNNLPQEEYQNREVIKENNLSSKFCKKCGKVIHNVIIQDNKRIDGRRRVYCLECSPFGLRRMCGPNPLYYKKGDAIKVKVKGRRVSYKVDRICQECGKIYHQASRNNTCSTCRTAKKRKFIKKTALEYKGGKCENCGYDKCSAALDFHHTDPTKKEFNISILFGRKFDLLKIELDKCVLLCSNCHRELHAAEKENKNNKQE